jgi:hypothetical protein
MRGGADLAPDVPAGDYYPHWPRHCEKHLVHSRSREGRYSIDAVNKGVDTDLTSGLKLEAKYFAHAAGTQDKKEGTSAFVQKRAPQFQGK